MNVNEWKPLIDNKLIDYIRCHVSTIGGITPAKNWRCIASLTACALHGMGTGDISPVGVCANMHLDLSSPNFGIQGVHADE